MDEDLFTSAYASGVCEICDNRKTILRPWLAVRLYPEYRRLAGLCGMPCPKCTPEAAQAAVHAAHQKEIDRLLRIAKVPEKFRDKTLDDFCDDPKALVAAGLTHDEAGKRREWKAQLTRYISRLKENLTEGIGVTFAGPVGTGKTLASAIVAREIVLLRRSVVSIPERGIFQAITSTYGDGMRETEADVMSEFENASVLMIDDFGTKKPTEWVVDRYHSIIDSRWDQGLPTFVSTNLREDALRAIYPRQMDRLSCNVKIDMIGDSLRNTVFDRRGRRNPNG